jgi:ankyrin repeat protein
MALASDSHNGHIGIVRRLLKIDIEMEVRGADCCNVALYNACRGGHTDIVQILLENGANVNGRSGTRDTAIQSACSNGNIETVQLLLENGAWC